MKNINLRTKTQSWPPRTGECDTGVFESSGCYTVTIADGPPEYNIGKEKEIDLEAPECAPAASGHGVATPSSLVCLVAWFCLNLALTISNKTVLRRARYPWLLTAVQTSATSLGCFAVMGFCSLKLSYLGTRDSVVMMAFSALFTFNIAMSNVSLSMVSVPLHQVMRSTCPVFTILIYRSLWARDYPTTTYLSLMPLVLGVGLATAGDYHASVAGFLLTLLGVMLASVKTVVTNQLMTGSLSLSAMELLLRMSPLAATQCVVYAITTGEVAAFRQDYVEGGMSTSLQMMLLANAITAFLVNIVSFQANKLGGALTMTVAGNVKQALTILLGIVIFNVQIGLMNAAGIGLALFGAACYSTAELVDKRTQRQ